MLGKIADTMFTLKAGSYVWPSDMFEPLTIAFVKPLFPKSPWKVGRLSSVVKWECDVRKVQFGNQTDVWRHMRKFWSPTIR